MKFQPPGSYENRFFYVSTVLKTVFSFLLHSLGLVLENRTYLITETAEPSCRSPDEQQVQCSK